MNRDKLFDILLENEPENVQSATATEVSTKNDRIGWKGAYVYTKKDPYVVTPVLMKLRIPYRALRTKYENPLQERYCKHRCTHAEVLEFYSYYTGKKLNPDDFVNGKGWSIWSADPIYKKGSITRPHSTYDTHLYVCASGIHYFYEKESALMYLDWEYERTSSLRKNAYRKFERL